MQGEEADHLAPGHPGSSACPVDMVVVGHAGMATVQTSEDKETSLGGSGYAVAACAAALIGGRVGLVAQVGKDFDLTLLSYLGANLDGVALLLGSSASLRIEQFEDGTRSFSSELGVAATVRLDSFPPSYLHAKYIHLGTAPPEQQFTWLRYLHDHGCTAQISADMFEHYVDKYRYASREVCENANLLFMNQAEYDGLYGSGPPPKAPLILKRGRDGARIIADGLPRDVRVPPVARVVDPTGGGEILAGVFLALRAVGLEEVTALKYAARAAASCVEEYGVHGPRLSAALADIRAEVRARSA